MANAPQVDNSAFRYEWQQPLAVAGIASEQDDLQDVAALAPLRGPAGALAKRGLELRQQGRANAREFLLLTFRKMVETGLHSGESSQKSASDGDIFAPWRESAMGERRVRRALRTCETSHAPTPLAEAWTCPWVAPGGAP